MDLPSYLVPVWLGCGLGLLLHQQACFGGKSTYNRRSKPVSKIIADRTKGILDRMIEKELKDINEVSDFQ